MERIGNFEYFNQKIVASNAGLQTIKNNARQVIGSADLVVYMAYDETSLFGTIGIAWRPVICKGSGSDGSKTSINEWRPESVSFGGVIFLFLIVYRFYISLKFLNTKSLL